MLISYLRGSSRQTATLGPLAMFSSLLVGAEGQFSMDVAVGAGPVGFAELLAVDFAYCGLGDFGDELD